MGATGVGDCVDDLARKVGLDEDGLEERGGERGRSAGIWRGARRRRRGCSGGRDREKAMEIHSVGKGKWSAG
jgi:hypothetical protein